MGQPDFRVDGKIFATLAAADCGYGNLMLRPEQQEILVQQLPQVFVPLSGGWGRIGLTHIRLVVATENELTFDLQMAWELRLEKNKGSTRADAVRPCRESPLDCWLSFCLHELSGDWVLG